MMRAPIAAALLVLAGCATGRGSGDLLESGRGFATTRSMDCARLLLEQRGYYVEAERGSWRAVKSFRGRDSDLMVQGTIRVGLEPADDGRAALRVRTDRRLSGGASRRDPSSRLYPSALLEAAVITDDADAVLRECTSGAA